jgi:DNA mismatch repair protein MutS2
VPDLTAALALLRVEGAVLEGRALVELRRLLTAARELVTELRAIAEDAPRAAARVRPLPDRALERRLELSVDGEGELLDSASPALAGARQDIRTSRNRLIQKLESLLRGLEGGAEGAVTVRNGRYVIPVPRDSRSRPAGIVHDESASGATLFLEPSAALELGNALREAEVRAERAELAVCRELTDLLRPERPVLAEALEMCVAMDDLMARARYAAATDAACPELVASGGPLVIRRGRHPLLLSVLPAGSVVPFDLELAGDLRTLLLSGPNTGGKTVLLKAVGVICALAQAGILPPVGPGSSLPVFGGFFADIGDRQSITASLSTFSAHVAVVRRILEAADGTSLVLLDEIGSGTDPAEGAALASAVLTSLTRRGAVTLATTHLGALKELATRTSGIANASLQFDGATLQPTYRLLQGVPGRSYGLAIARRLGVPEVVLQDAEAQVPDNERSFDRLLADVEQRQRAQESRAAELEARAADLENLAARLTIQLEGQEHREQGLRQRERESERSARAQSRAFLLEARQKVEEAIAKARAAVTDEAAREARRMVEEAVKGETVALERVDSGGRAGGRTGGHEQVILPGARVRLATGPAGELLEVRSDGRALVRIGSLKMVADLDTLVALEGVPKACSPSTRPSASPPVRPSAATEIDLRGLTSDEAEAAVVLAIDEAVLAEQPYLRIIHGKGTGALRERVRRIVESDGRVARSAFAPPNQGGSGVTVVEFDG